MIQIKVTDMDIELDTNLNLQTEEEELKNLRTVISAIIGIYKYRIEKIYKHDFSRAEEIVIDQKIKEDIVILSMDEMKKHMNEKHG